MKNELPPHSGFDCPVQGERIEDFLKEHFDEIDGYFNAYGEWIPLTSEDKRRIINGN